MQRDLLDLALVDLRWMLPRRRGYLVGDGDHGVEALLARDVEVVLELLNLQLVGAALYLDQRRPRAIASFDPDQPIGKAPGLAEQEGHLGIGLECSCRCPERLSQRPAELPHGDHHR